ncbi:MAG: T9SS type A sorting domain-containing protein [Bacteroidales bacterium]
MRTKTLLFLFLLTCGVLNAQDTIKTLVISEARLDDHRVAYCEIANVGTEDIELAEFEFGIIGAWTQPWNPGANNYLMLPEKTLAPGETFIISSAFDFFPEQYPRNPERFGPPNWNKVEFWDLADIMLHAFESPSGPTDSVTPQQNIMTLWGGRDCLYLRHHLSNGDSVVVDQINGVFDGTDGTRANKGAYNVAGMTNATANATLVRKFTIKEGTDDFINGAGQDLSESEWMPIPLQYANDGLAGVSRRLFWTAKNHGAYVLDENTLEPRYDNGTSVDFAEGVINVPWGVQREDSMIFQFVQKPGIAWHYHQVASYPDSAYLSARTGDTLTLYVCGNDLYTKDFHINVLPPSEDASIVVTKMTSNADGFYNGNNMYCRVSDGNPVIDTISSAGFPGFGIDYNTRKDTLLTYLEKAPNAEWEIVWVDGQERADLKNGDKLKVTAESGAIKEYFIKVNKPLPSHNAYLSSITWPDIPEDFKGLFGWDNGDTIPGFNRSYYGYKVMIPMEATGVPVLVGKAEEASASVKVQRAVSLKGTPAQKTITFSVTAEDDTTINHYAVQVEQEKDPALIQPFYAEPFFSQFIFRDQWANNYLEVANPGNTTINMSNYMICSGYNVNTPADAITRLSNPTGADWTGRYQKYIPGYKWEDSIAWKLEPVIAVPDISVNPNVAGGDVFTLGQTNGIGQVTEAGMTYATWFTAMALDIDFGANYNPWGDNIGGGQALEQWLMFSYYLFKIENDSIQRGLKPANDPNDFTLLDVIGSGENDVRPVMNGRTVDQIMGFVRKPEIFLGNPEYKGSHGTNDDDSEWIFTDRAYYNARNVGWPLDILYVCQGLGSHFVNDPTIYISTVSSLYYKISPGYSEEETIEGIVTDTTVAGFLADLIKKDPGQTLIVKSGVNGDTLEMTEVLTDGDSLLVTSADLKTTTKYLLSVADVGLSNDALLTSETYNIAAEAGEGSVSGFPYGTKLSAVAAGVSVPAGATMTIIDENGAYVPFKILNYDTVYVDVLASDKIFFEVVAEDGRTEILYQLQPTASNSDAFVISNVFSVTTDEDFLTGSIDFVPPGISPSALLANLTPAAGASMKLIDKLGDERLFGNVAKDDRVFVKSADGTVERIYLINIIGVAPPSYAYVVSDVYTVDQQAFQIEGPDDQTTVATFTTNILAAPDATFVIRDAQDNEKTTGTLTSGDVVVVTSGDGQTIVTYVINVADGISNPSSDKVRVYPVPTRNSVTVAGIEVGNRIEVTNILGMRILDKVAVSEKETVSLEGQRNGVYFITVRTDRDVIGRYKVVKE